MKKLKRKVYRWSESKLRADWPNMGAVIDKAIVGMTGDAHGAQYQVKKGDRFFTDKAFAYIQEQISGAPAASALPPEVLALLVQRGGAPGNNQGTTVVHYSDVTPEANGNGQKDDSSANRMPIGGRSTFTGINPELDQHEMQVDRLVPNTTMVLCTCPELPGVISHVVVGNSTNFRKGMLLPVGRHPTQKAFWVLLGKLPRHVGRW